MYSVDVYLRVRRAVMVDGMSMREAARVFGLHRDTVRKMLAYSVPPGYRRQSPPRKPKLDPYTGVIDRILEDDLRRPRKQRHTAKRIFERLQGRVRVRRWIHHSQGLCKRESPSDQGDVRPSVPCAGPRPVRLRRGLGGHRRRGAQGPLLRNRPVPQRRLLREGLPGGDHRGLLGRARFRLRLPGRSAPEHPLRQYQAGRSEDTGGRPSPAHPRLHRVAVPLPVRGPVRAVPARATTKAKWRAWWGTCAATSWFRCRPSRASMRSMPTWSGVAWNEWTPSSGDIWRPSVNGWSGTWTPCCPCLPVALRRLREAGGPGEFPVVW